MYIQQQQSTYIRVPKNKNREERDGAAGGFYFPLGVANSRLSVCVVPRGLRQECLMGGDGA